MIKAVIFDMDGTMVDTETIHSESFAELIRSFGYTPKPNNNGLVHPSGLNLEGILQLLMKQYGFTGDIQAMGKRVREIYFNLLQKNTIQPMPGLKKLLDELKKENIICAVASGSSSRNIHAMLTKLQLQDYFTVVIGADEVTNGKPDPEIYEVAVTKLGIQKDECIVIEDTETGIRSAKNAGLKVVAVPNKFTKDQNFSKADTIVNSLSDITIDMLKTL